MLRTTALAIWLLVVVVAGAAWREAARPGGLPLNTVAPAVTGVALLGQTMTASPGRWSGTLPLTFAYQWERCPDATASCAPIPAATGQSYVLQSADVGEVISVQVTATNASGPTSASSTPTATVAASAPPGAAPIAGGGLSLPIADVAPPDRLILASVQSRPVPAPHGFLVRVQVDDSAGYAIRGALVSLTALPYGLFAPTSGVATNRQGLALLTVQPAPHAWLEPDLQPAVLVRADVPGSTQATDLSATSLLRLGLAPSAPHAATESLYSPGARGFDLSYPNCARRPATDPDFAILGVNGGRPFTFNPCLRRQYGWFAAGPQAVYLNTGYDSSLRRRITPACALATGSLHGSAAAAYAVGCSEAATSLERIMLLGLAPPAIWWLDVEPSNSWSSTPALNAQVLHGMMDFLAKLSPTPPVGIYSRPSWWQTITGNWTTAAPEWIPTPTNACPAAFSSGPVWLAQNGSASLDIDTAC